VAAVHEMFIWELGRLAPDDLARLRAAVGRRMDIGVRPYDAFTGIWWRLREVAFLPRQACWAVATLYPWNMRPRGFGNMGEALGRVAPLRPRDRERFRARVSGLVAARGPALTLRLAGAVRALNRAGRGVDWPRLLGDLCHWDAPGGAKQEEWVTAYFKAENAGGIYAR